jgi:hypothetical protein
MLIRDLPILVWMVVSCLPVGLAVSAAKCKDIFANGEI